MWGISKILFHLVVLIVDCHVQIQKLLLPQFLPIYPALPCIVFYCVLLHKYDCMAARQQMLWASNNAEWVWSCHYMGTRSPFKPTRLHWLFRVTIDFLTKAMTSLISPLVCHLTQMGSLAAGSDNNSSGSQIGWIKHTARFTANVHYTL